MLELTQRVAATFKARLVPVRDDEEGQTLVEYALIIALVSIALITALGLMTDALNGVFSRITSELNKATP